jgi:predicted phage terminase large subunit-like protein
MARSFRDRLHARVLTDDFGRFVRAAWPLLEPSTPLLWSWHLDVLTSHLEAFIRDAPGTPQNLMINVPPGSMKSLLSSVFLPAWVWLWRPSWRVICASGNPRVVTRDSTKCRQVVRSDWYQKTFAPEWQISKDQDEKQWFATDASGFRLGIGAGSAATGSRADCLLIDDANEAATVHSKAERDNINEQWWRDSFSNRIADVTKSKRLIIMQRLHDDDLAGYVLREEAGQWEHLCLRMESERPPLKKTWLGWEDTRATGELLFPARFTPAFVETERKKGSAYFAGQHQQRPVSASGNRFQRAWWGFWSATGEQLRRPEGCSVSPPLRWSPVITARHTARVELIQSVDATFKGGDGSDFVVVMMLAQQGPKTHVLAVDRAKRGYGDTVRAIRAQRAAWTGCRTTLVEDKANGSAIIETLKGEFTGIVAVNPLGGKEARAAAIESTVEAGDVYLPEGWEGIGDFVDEFASFPKGSHDDQVDALSQALLWLQIRDDAKTNTRALLGLS